MSNAPISNYQFDINPEFDPDPHAAIPTKNVNFFSEIERKEREGKLKEVKKNPEEERDRKKRAEIEERKMFQIHRLGGSSIESSGITI